MKAGLFLVSFWSAFGGQCAPTRGAEPALRAPAVPLVPVDPYFSIWSPGDKLNEAATTHWTEAPNRLTSLAFIDGKAHRLMGRDPAGAVLAQTDLKVMPATVAYTFEGEGVRIGLSFMTPLLPEDLVVFSRPVAYLTWDAVSTDGQEHEVQVHFDAAADIAVHDPQTEKVTWAGQKLDNLEAMRIGSAEQPVLRRKGDGVRIDWGYLYVAVAGSQHGRTAITIDQAARRPWGPSPPRLLMGQPVAPASEAPVLAVQFDLGKVAAKPVSRWLIIAYDDVDAVQYFHRNLKAYWKKDGAEIGDLLTRSAAEYESLRKRCAEFDREMMVDLEKAGGPKYAWICALAYRQSLAASKVVADSIGQPLYFCKENTSNGCMGTVDVFYPQAPLPLLISPTLSKAMLVPILEYASSPGWTWPNAPHDVGTWPQANGQVYGGLKSNGGMPVEETGNMLLLVAAVAEVEGNADFAGRYWPLLTRWADYLKDFGRDPENQLCTDDFAGHLAHNANLAGKAICALGAYGKLAAMRGEKEAAEKYTAMAREYALGWVKQADDGDHFRLAFDKPGSWSSKYNLVWDRILGLDLFPAEAVKKEMAFYRKNIDKYGLPLDGRKQGAGGGREGPRRSAYWSKTDWAFWTACLTGDPEDFQAITGPVYEFYREARRRVGLTDLYFTDQPDAARMHSRPVIGGLFIKMLYDREVWKKWASRDKTRAAGPWAPLPPAPRIVEVVKPASTTWRSTTEKPADGWFRPGFDDSAWKPAKGGFGSRGTPGAEVNTEWKTADIWLRGEITIPPGDYHDLQLYLHHDEDVEVYIDGAQAARLTGFTTEYEPVPVGRRASLKPGKSLFAIHCRQTGGGQYIDLGIADLETGK